MKKSETNSGYLLLNRDVVDKIRSECTPTEWFVLYDFISRATYKTKIIEVP